MMQSENDYLRGHIATALQDYGVRFPLYAEYKRSDNRIYTVMDFQDREKIKFLCLPERSSSIADGYAFYSSLTFPYVDRLVSVADIEEIDETGIS